VKDGVVHTADAGVLEGISRRTAIELCQRLEIPINIAPLPAAAMRQADEVFLTSSGGGILPIAKLDGVPLPHFPGPVAERLFDAYWAIHDEAAYRDPVAY
jgi:branched-chain amino acid aminotransferase